MFVGITVFLFSKIGAIKILHKERIPRKMKRVIVVCNHPSLLEVVIIPALFLRNVLRNPYKNIPWSTPDLVNFYNRWPWFWIKDIAIPIKREDQKEELRALFAMKQALFNNGVIVLFAEGSRTFKGTEFLFSKKGKKIRPFKNGIGMLIARTKAEVLPIWIENTDKVLPNHPNKLYAGVNIRGERVVIKVGELTRIRTTQRLGSAEEVTHKVEELLLALADEE